MIAALLPVIIYMMIGAIYVALLVVRAIARGRHRMEETDNEDLIAWVLVLVFWPASLCLSAIVLVGDLFERRMLGRQKQK